MRFNFWIKLMCKIVHLWFVIWINLDMLFNAVGLGLRTLLIFKYFLLIIANMFAIFLFFC